jgi:hypothetical protein
MWAEFTIPPHGRVRVVVDSQGGKATVGHGMDSKKCASFKRMQFYVKDAQQSGKIRLDLVPGEHNPSGILTKRTERSASTYTRTAFCAAQTQ